MYRCAKQHSEPTGDKRGTKVDELHLTPLELIDCIAALVPPPRPPAQLKLTTSICEPHRAFIEAQLRFKRNYMAFYQDLVDNHGFTGACNSVKRFAGGLCKHEPEQFDRLEFAPGEGALTRVAGTDRFRKPRLFVMTLRYSRRSFRRVV